MVMMIYIYIYIYIHFNGCIPRLIVTAQTSSLGDSFTCVYLTRSKSFSWEDFWSHNSLDTHVMTVHRTYEWILRNCFGVSFDVNSDQLNFSEVKEFCCNEIINTHGIK